MKIISKETSKRVCDHMNNDHIDSVHKYLSHYGKISTFENACLYILTMQQPLKPHNRLLM